MMRNTFLLLFAAVSFPRGAAADEWEQLNNLLSKVTLSLGTISNQTDSFRYEAANLEVTGPSVTALAITTKLETGKTTVGLTAGLIADITSSPFALYYGALGGNGSADIHVAIDLDIELALLSTAPGHLPIDMQVQSCKAQVPDFSLYCTGGGFTLGAACTAVSGLAPALVGPLLCGTDGKSGIIGNFVNKYEDLPALIAAAIETAGALKPPAPTPASKAEAPFVNDTEGVADFNGTTLRTVGRVITDVYGGKDKTGDLVVNDALRRLFPEGRASLSLDTYLPLNLTLLGVTLQGVRIQNINISDVAFSKLALLDPLGRLTTSNSLNMSANVSVGIALDLKVGDGPVGPKESVLVEGITLALGLRDIALDLQLLAGIDEHKLGKVTLGAVLQGGLLNCLLGSMLPKGLQFTGLVLKSGSLSHLDIILELEEPSVPGSSGGLNAFLADGVNALSLLYGADTLKALPFVTAEFLVPWITKKAEAAIAANPVCTYTAPPDAIVDATEGPLWILLDAVINTLTGAVNEPYGINAIIEALVPGGQAGLGDGFGWTNNGEALAGISLGNLSVLVQDPRASGLEEWTKFQLMHPTKPTNLEVDLGAGHDGPEISLYMHLLWTGVGDVLNDSMGVNVQLQDSELTADINAAIDVDKSHALQLGSLTDVGCLLQSLDSLRLPAMLAAVQGVRLVLNCTDPTTGENACHSPLMPEAAANLQTPEGQAALTSGLMKLLALVNKTLTAPQAQEQYEKWVLGATCPSPPSQKKGALDSTPGEIVLYILVGGGVSAVFLFTLIYTWCRARTVIREAREQTEGELPPLFELFECGESMFFHPTTGFMSKWGVPLALVTALGCLISANIDPAATYVNVKLQIAGDQIELDHVFDFSLHVAVVDMWNAGVYPLSFLVALFSGTWAYTKLILLFWAWFMPPKLLKPSTRAPILEVLDFFGKYSLVDLYVMVMLAVSFRLHMDVSEATRDVLPDGFFILDLIVAPGWGLYGYVIAVFASVIIGHIEIVRHRDLVTAVTVQERERGVANRSDAETSKSTASSWFREGESDTRRQSLFSHVYKRSPFPSWMTVPVDAYSQGRTGFTKLACWAQFMLSLFVFITLLAVCVGSFIRSFAFKFKGAAAGAVYITPGEDTYRSYSVASLPFKMMEQANDEIQNKLGYAFVSGCVLVTTVICPILQLVSLLVLWTVPLTLVQHKLAFFVTECLSASSAFEVFVIALFAALLQLTQFAQFVVGDKCDAINDGMSVLADLGFFGHDQALCFNVNASLEEGCYLLFTASVTSYVCYAIINYAARIAIKEREKSAVGTEHHSFHPGSCSDGEESHSEAPPRP